MATSLSLKGDECDYTANSKNSAGCLLVEVATPVIGVLASGKHIHVLRTIGVLLCKLK